MSSTKRKAENLLPENSAKRYLIDHGAKKKRIELLLTSKWSDFTITCQGNEFNIHRTIIIGHSEFLDKAIDGSFQESSTQRLDLPENDPIVVAVALWYIYTGDFTPEHALQLLGTNHSSAVDEHLFYIKLYCFADQIMHEKLKMDVFPHIIKLAKLYYLITRPDKDTKVTIITELSEITELVFSTINAPPEIRKFIAWILCYLHNRNSKSSKLSDDELAQITDGLPEAYTMMYQVMVSNAAQHALCDHCHKEFSHHFKERAVLVEVGADEPETISCRCAWNGICSLGCKMEPGSALLGVIYCTSCAAAVGKGLE